VSDARDERTHVDLDAAERPASAGGEDTVAAVDLGSNSFHMVIGRVVEPDVRILDRLRERVQLAAGLDAKGRLSEAAQERALSCLERFGQRLRGMPVDRVRAVGTNTLRRAKNSASFLARARQALGHPIEVVSGREEARLVFLGVSHSLPETEERRLVVDIGGGSTECILGERFEALEAESMHMGCVSYTLRFFGEGELKRDSFRKAEIAARLELQTIERRFRATGWEDAAGASGTVNAIAEIVRQNGWSDQGITRYGLRKLRKALTSAGSTDKLDLPGLKADRAAVLPGGLAILIALFDSLGVAQMRPAKGALREGVLYDLLGRIRHEDVRDRTIRRFEERYHVDLEQAARVEWTALHLLRQVAPDWRLDVAALRPLLSWAARLHEIGLAIAYSSHHKHGAYLVTHSDMPGFSNDGRRAVAALIRAHRGKLRPQDLPDLQVIDPEALLRLALVLRLAVVLNRSRSGQPLEDLRVVVHKKTLRLRFPEGLLDGNPLTKADLDREKHQFSRAGYRLKVAEVEAASPSAPPDAS